MTDHPDTLASAAKRKPDYWVFDDGDERPIIKRYGEVINGSGWEPLYLPGALAAHDRQDPDLFEFRGVWHVRHADGTTEDITLEHGNLVEDGRGTCGQFILSHAPDVSDTPEPPSYADRVVDAIKNPITPEGGQPDTDDELADGLPEALYIDIESEIHMHMGHDGQSDEANDWVTDMMSAISPHILRAMLKSHARGVFQGLAEARSHGEVLARFKTTRTGPVSAPLTDSSRAIGTDLPVPPGTEVLVVRATADQGEPDGE